MVVVHKRKKRIINSIVIGLGIDLCICIFLLQKVKYWAPEKGEFGTRRVSTFEILKENPDKLKGYIIIFISVVLVSLILGFLKNRFIKDWRNTL